MPAPSFSVTIGDRGPTSPQPGDVGSWFAVGLFDRGPTNVVTECRSLSAVKATYGDVVSYSPMIRAAEAYFREANGAGRMLVKRQVGPSATKGVLALSSAAPAVVMTLTAISPGTWSTELTVTVVTGTDPARTVTFKQAGQVVFSQVFTTAAALKDAFEATGLVTVALGVGSWPLAVLAETALSAGSDDRASIPTTEAGWRAELDTILNDHDDETGLVSIPGVTTPAAHAALFHFGQDARWFALADAIDTATVVSLTAPAATIRATDQRAGYGQVLAPWVKIPGPGSGTVTIPPSGADAGRKATADRENRAGPGQPAAAGFGIFRYVQDVTQEWSKADRDILADAGLTVIRNIKGQVQPYGSRTVADPDEWPQYASAAGMRVVLAIASECRAALGEYIEKVIDGNGHIYSEIEKDLVGIAQSWFERTALFGASPGEAFLADVGPGAVPRSIAANLVIRPSESVNTINLLITTVAASDTI